MHNFLSIFVCYRVRYIRHSIYESNSSCLYSKLLVRVGAICTFFHSPLDHNLSILIHPFPVRPPRFKFISHHHSLHVHDKTAGNNKHMQFQQVGGNWWRAK